MLTRYSLAYLGLIHGPDYSRLIWRPFDLSISLTIKMTSSERDTRGFIS